MSEKKEKIYLIWGELTTHPKWNIPIMELKTKNNVTEEESVFGYLSPFRGYFFQISATYDGSGCYADYRLSNNAMMKNSFKDCPRGEKAAIYRMMINSTILECLSNNYGKDFHPSWTLTQELGDDRLEKFVEASIDWVESLK